MSDEMVEIDEFVAEESDYEILGFANDETTIYVNQLFGQCPDEMGAFLLVTHGEGSFSIYQAEAGCEFCGTDAFSNWRVSVDEPITRQKASDFVNQFEFTPLVVIPVGLMRRVCVDRTIADMIRDDFDGPNFPKARVGREIVKAVKLEMGGRWSKPTIRSKRTGNIALGGSGLFGWHACTMKAGNGRRSRNNEAFLIHPWTAPRGPSIYLQSKIANRYGSLLALAGTKGSYAVEDRSARSTSRIIRV